MTKQTIRHWVLLDDDALRRWLTDERIRLAHIIDNKDGTFGRAFDLRWVDPDIIIAASETMQTALQTGSLDHIEPLPTSPPRVLRHAPSLQDLVVKHGGYDRITSAAWDAYDAELAKWKEDVRLGFAEVSNDQKR